MDLSDLGLAEGVVHSDDLRRDRGHGSGNGRIAGKGRKDQKARFGAPRPGFEDGQMSLYGRLPRRGFENRNTRGIMAISVEELEKFESGNEVMAESLIAFGITSHARDDVKILGNGKLTKKLIVKVNAVNEGAKAKIETVGGTCEVL